MTKTSQQVWALSSTLRHSILKVQCLDRDRYLDPVVPVLGTSLARSQDRYSDRCRREWRAGVPRLATCE